MECRRMARSERAHITHTGGGTMTKILTAVVVASCATVFFAALPANAKIAANGLAPMPVNERIQFNGLAPMPVNERMAANGLAPTPVNARMAANGLRTTGLDLSRIGQKALGK